MSQAKVDRYKEEKKNRQKLIKKEKRNERIWKMCGVVIAVVLIGWVGYSGYLSMTKDSAPKGETYSVDTAALDDFMSNLTAETE